MPSLTISSCRQTLAIAQSGVGDQTHRRPFPNAMPMPDEKCNQSALIGGRGAGASRKCVLIIRRFCRGNETDQLDQQTRHNTHYSVPVLLRP